MNTSIVSEIKTVTPEMAAILLTGNIGNRPLKRRQIRKYATDMLAGRWVLNGESIKLSQSGRLLDGQNRLHAIIESQTSVPILVTRGLPDSEHVFETIDCGAMRSCSDALKLAGKKYTTVIPAIIRAMATAQDTDRTTLSNAYVTATTEAHYESLCEAAEATEGVKDIIVRSCYGAFYWHYLQRSPEMIRRFHELLTGLQGLPSKSPVLALHKSLRRLGKSRSTSSNRTAMNMCAHAFKLWTDGRSVNYLSKPGCNYFSQPD